MKPCVLSFIEIENFLKNVMKFTGVKILDYWNKWCQKKCQNWCHNTQTGWISDTVGDTLVTNLNLSTCNEPFLWTIIIENIIFLEIRLMDHEERRIFLTVRVRENRMYSNLDAEN